MEFRQWLENTPFAPAPGPVPSFEEKLQELKSESGFAKFAHGAGESPQVKQHNLQNGIVVSTDSPTEHFTGLDTVTVDQLYNWPHRGYKNIWVVFVPENTRYRDVLKFHPTNERKYVVPTNYIRGFFDVENSRWVDGVDFDPQPVPMDQGEVSKQQQQVLPRFVVDPNRQHLDIPQSSSHSDTVVGDVW